MKSAMEAIPGSPGQERGDSSLAYHLGLLLGDGTSSLAAQTAARRLLRHFGDPLGMTQASPAELQRAGCISPRQADRLLAAISLGTSLCSSPMRPGERFASSRSVYLRYRARFFPLTREHFLSLHLNAKNQLIREVLVSVGSLSTSVVHPREAFAPAVRDSAAALIFLHNHPSGDPAPSREDRECTQRLSSAGRVLGIRVLDHIILGHDDYFSFADAGIMEQALDSRPG